MSNIKISEMAEAESLNDNDLLTIVQSGVNKKITKQNAIGDIIQAINNPTYTTTEGTNLSIDNTRVGKMKFKFYGDTEQDSYNGENLFDKDNPNILNNCVTGSGLTLDTAEGCKTLYVPCKPNLTYTITKVASTRFIVVTTTDTPAIGVATSTRTIDLTATSITITTGATANYICVFYYYSLEDTLTEQEILNSIYIKIDTPIPNPNNTIDIQTVTGDNTVNIIGKNRYNCYGKQIMNVGTTFTYVNGRITVTMAQALRVKIENLTIGQDYIISWGNFNINSIQFSKYLNDTTLGDQIARNYTANSTISFTATQSNYVLSILVTAANQYVDYVQLEKRFNS